MLTVIMCVHDALFYQSPRYYRPRIVVFIAIAIAYYRVSLVSRQ